MVHGPETARATFNVPIGNWRQPNRAAIHSLRLASASTQDAYRFRQRARKVTASKFGTQALVLRS